MTRASLRNTLAASRIFLTLALGALLSGCSASAGDSPGEQLGQSAEAVEGCSGYGADLFGQFCAVGESNGHPAVNYRGQWFSLDYNGGDWAISNAVSATPIEVAPVDNVSRMPPCDESMECDSDCPIEYPGSTIERTCLTRLRLCQTRCRNRSSLLIEGSRTFTFVVAGQTFTIEGYEKSEDMRVTGSAEQVRIRYETGFKITTNDPGDGNPWSIALQPRRTKSGASDQNAVNEQVTAPEAVTETAAPLALFPTADLNAFTTAEMEIMTAVKSGAPGASAITANSNVAMNKALEGVLGAGSSFQNQYEPEAIQTIGNVLSRVPGANGFSANYDLQRFSQFYLNNRRGQAGFSSQGSGERPLVETEPKEFRFSHTILDYNVHYSFLAGICGLEAGVHSYVAGSYASGRSACFDGLATSVSQRGNLEFALQARGGFGCNIFVASASAGLSGSVKAAVEFATDLHTDTLPPSISADVNIYSEVSYAAHFKVRVLFWTKKWEKNTGPRRLFQKSASFRLTASHPDPAVQLCDYTGPPRGTCDDPAASCDMTGRCVRYQLAESPTESPTRVDVGACNNFTPLDGPVTACFPQTVELRGTAGGVRQGFCTGTLLANRTVATAAHCLTDYILNGVYTNVEVVIVGGGTADGSQRIPVRNADLSLSPLWRADLCRGAPFPINVAGDIGVIRLSEAPVGITPAELGATSLGASVIRLGYGLKVDGTGGDDLRRIGNFRVDFLGSGRMATTSAVNATCPGDSGGPVFPNQREADRCVGRNSAPILVGIHHGSVPSCTFGSTQYANDVSSPRSTQFLNAAINRTERALTAPECCPGLERTCVHAGTPAPGCRQTCNINGSWTACFPEPGFTGTCPGGAPGTGGTGGSGGGTGGDGGAEGDPGGSGGSGGSQESPPPPPPTCTGCQTLDPATNTCTNLPAGAEGNCGTCQDCDGNGQCGFVANGQQDAGCNAAATACSGADTCNGAGACSVNNSPAGAEGACATCQDCDGNGNCAFVADGQQDQGCSAAATACSGADTCNGAGACGANHLPAGAEGACATCQDCDGSGNCAFVANGQQDVGCDAAAASCSAADVCDGSGACKLGDVDRLTAGVGLRSNEALWSCDARFQLVMQGDGNLVLYGPHGALWAAGGSGANWAVMQGDGNFVLYNPYGALWASNTGYPGAQLILQTDGNLVVYTAQGQPVWASGTSLICGDGYCDAPETFSSCTEDCGYCGDGYCSTATENQNTCPWDCGSPGYCGDGLCDSNFEDPWACPRDCGGPIEF